MAQREEMTLIDNPVIKGREDYYTEITINVPSVIKSWQESLYSFEWLLSDGRIKDLKELPEAEQSKRQAIEDALSKGMPIEKPVLGIGMMDNIEIGSGKAALLTLAAHGHKQLAVHIPKSNESDFQDFRADVE